MRLLHPETIRIIATEDIDFSGATVSRRQVLSHAWSEVLKYMATKQEHPKMFIKDEFDLGVYLKYVYIYATRVGCKFKPEVVDKYPTLKEGFCDTETSDLELDSCIEYLEDHYICKGRFDDNYLFSDCISLYLKGVNIMPFTYGDDWRRLVPIESLKEIYRVVGKTLDKRSK